MATNTTNSSILDITQLCIQRTRRQLLMTPPPRLEVLSPYPQYTTIQLSMRRKAEVLSYSSASSNSKTNNLSKSERFAQLVHGQTQRRSFSQELLQNLSQGRISCPLDRTHPSLTSACDVPGPIQILQFDPTIPLYNYAGVTTNAVSETNRASENDLFRVIPSTSPLSIPSNQMSGIVGTLFLQKTFENNLYTFRIHTPITLSIQGYSSTLLNSIVCTLTNVYIYVYYNEIVIATNDPSFTSSSLSSSSISIPIVTLPTPHQVSLTNIGTSWNGTLYLGNIETEVSLYAQPGFIYDIQYKPILTTSSPSLVNYTGLIFNDDRGNLKTENRMTFSTHSSNDANIGFTAR